ncbi:hypothetical protein EYF80_019492 [Liparis tanakae]|uniref:Uncharacterized protein n=1 Tax=Liparis tanakae TaxID=230148 RepID=A0A4Z2HX75_9TELE|nr:hypothetical protein EYF80_019492 [Liparis tanakae]
MPSVSLSLPTSLAGRARTWVCLSCMFWLAVRVRAKRAIQTRWGGGVEEALPRTSYATGDIEPSRCEASDPTRSPFKWDRGGKEEER